MLATVPSWCTTRSCPGGRHEPGQSPWSPRYTHPVSITCRTPMPRCFPRSCQTGGSGSGSSRRTAPAAYPSRPCRRMNGSATARAARRSGVARTMALSRATGSLVKALDADDTSPPARCCATSTSLRHSRMLPGLPRGCWTCSRGRADGRLPPGPARRPARARIGPRVLEAQLLPCQRPPGHHAHRRTCRSPWMAGWRCPPPKTPACSWQPTRSAPVLHCRRRPAVPQMARTGH